MKLRLTTIANLATIGACLMIGVTAAPILKARWFGSAEPAGGRSPVEYVDREVRTSIPKTTVTGNPRATLALIEFSDFQCPFCARYVRETFPDIQKEYIDTGKLVYAFRHFPLSIHPLARDAGEAAQCAADQEQFWPMRAMLFTYQDALTTSDLMTYAGQLRLDAQRFESCLEGATRSLDEDVAEGKRLGVASTPTFVVGSIQPNGEVLVVSKIRGAQPLGVFSEVIQDALQKVSNQSE